MIRIVPLAFIVSLAVSAQAQQAAIVGKWAVFPSENSRIEESEGYCEFRSNFVAIFSKGSKSHTGTYKVVSRAKPYRLSITLTDPRNKQTIHTHALFGPIDENAAWLELFQPRSGNDKKYGGKESRGNSTVVFLRRVGKGGEVIGMKPAVDQVTPRLIGRWTLYPWADRADPGVKAAGTWELGANGEFAQESPGLHNSSYKGSFAIDASRSPNTIELSGTGGRVLCLFEFIGDDEVKVEFFPSPLERPTQFSDVEFSGDLALVARNIFILRRVK